MHCFVSICCTCGVFWVSIWWPLGVLMFDLGVPLVSLWFVMGAFWCALGAHIGCLLVFHFSLHLVHLLVYIWCVLGVHLVTPLVYTWCMMVFHWCLFGEEFMYVGVSLVPTLNLQLMWYCWSPSDVFFCDAHLMYRWCYFLVHIWWVFGVHMVHVGLWLVWLWFASGVFWSANGVSLDCVLIMQLGVHLMPLLMYIGCLLGVHLVTPLVYIWCSLGCHWCLFCSRVYACWCAFYVPIDG